MSKAKLSRRNFLQSIGAITISSSLLQGCKRKESRPFIYPSHTVFLPEDSEVWEDISPHLDNSLENSFAFDFRDIDTKGLEFNDVRRINNNHHFIDAQGFSFDSDLEGKTRSFTITDLRRNERGISIDLIENGSSIAFTRTGETIRTVVGNKDYEITLNSIAIPNNIGNSDSFPILFLKVNGKDVVVKKGKAHTEDLNLCLNYKDFNQGNTPLFLSQFHYRSCFDLGDDTKFSGLEYTLKRDHKVVNANFLNNSIQDDTYFRIDADTTAESIILRRTEKIRIPDSEFTRLNFNTRIRRATSYEIETKNQERYQDIEVKNSSVTDKGLEGDFTFEFSPLLEVRLEETPGFSLSFPSQLFNVPVQIDERYFNIRYIGIDTRKIPSNLEWNKFYPINSVFTEILEDPLELILRINKPVNINLNDTNYTLTLKRLRETSSRFQPIDFIINLQSESESEEIQLRSLTHNFPNRSLGLNIDPDLSLYHGKSATQILALPSHRFLISRNKFTSSVDYYDDKLYSGLKKSIIPHQNNLELEYQQLTLANRFNGAIQNNSFFRVFADLGVDHFRKNLPDPNNNSYDIIPSQGLELPDQINNGYIFRLHRIEKIKINN